jgi:hypothetical protein
MIGGSTLISILALLLYVGSATALNGAGKRIPAPPATTLLTMTIPSTTQGLIVVECWFSIRPMMIAQVTYPVRTNPVQFTSSASLPASDPKP